MRAVYDEHFDQLEFRAGKHSGSVKMFCNTTGHPIINRTWYYNGVEMKYRYYADTTKMTFGVENLSVSNLESNK